MPQLSATTAEVAAPGKTSSLAERMGSLDLFRGATIAFMIIVNNQDEEVAYWPLKHSQWNGWTPTELVFSFFIFIV